jgi:hypothetical protein
MRNRGFVVAILFIPLVLIALGVVAGTGAIEHVKQERVK